MDRPRSQNSPLSPHAVAADAASNGPTLRLRFDPPPEPGSQEFDQVLSEVEHLAQGIDTMLEHASSSAIGGGARLAGQASPDDDDDIDLEGDDPMLVMFDEEDSSDIHAIDRMLASQAQSMMGRLESADEAETPAIQTSASEIFASTSAFDAHAEVDAAHDQQEIALEGDFESIESLLGSPPLAAIPNPASTMAAAAAKTMELAPVPAPASTVAAQDFVVPQNASPAPIAGDGLQHTQAAALVPVVSPTSTVEPIAPPPVIAPAAVESVVRNAVAQAVQASAAPTMTATATPTSALPIPKRRLSLARPIVQVIALTNFPLRLAPPSLQPAVNMLAISLALWAPAIWFLAPRLAASQAAAATAALATPEHAESEIKAGDDHGSASGEHESKPAKTEKKSTASKKSSAKKSSAKKSTGDHAAPAAGGH